MRALRIRSLHDGIIEASQIGLIFDRNVLAKVMLLTSKLFIVELFFARGQLNNYWTIDDADIMLHDDEK